MLDIETAPLLSYTWGVWQQDVIDIKSNWYILSFAWKQLGEKKVHTLALPDFPGYEKNKENDGELVKALHNVFDRADIIIMHNGDRFDMRKSNARFIAHGLPPPSRYKTIDTLKIAKKHFAFDSNKLDNLARYLGLGRKLPHTGKHLWFGCMNGDPKSWATMKRYNAWDVQLLERVYLHLRPWYATHPDLNNYSRAFGCPACQSENTVHKGFAYFKAGKKQENLCNACGHRFVSGGIIK